MEFKKSDPRAAAVILLVIMLIAGAVYLRLWANAARLEVPTFRAMDIPPAGNVHIVIGNTLFIESPDGSPVKQIDLADWGVADFHGDLVVMDDGSVILARGQMNEISAGEAVRIVMRAHAVDDPVEKLMRCQPATNECAVLDGNGTGFELARAFSIDSDGRFLYVSEPAKHRVLKLSLEGELIAVNNEGWRFPNDARFVAPNRIGFVDTNHHRYVEARLDEKHFGEQLEETDIEGWPDIVRLLRFPSGAMKDEAGTLWMLVARDNMGNATLYRKPADGEAKLLPLPDDADPIALEQIAGSVLLADAHKFRVYRFDAAGNPQPDFGSPVLKETLGEFRERHDLYKLLFDFSLIGVLIVAVPALVLGYRLQQKTGEEENTQEASPSTVVELPTIAPKSFESQYAQLHGQYIFWRKYSALSTDTERWFIGAIIVFPALVALLGVAFIAAAIPDEDTLETLFTDKQFLTIAGGYALMLAGFWLSGMFERLIITREGIRYTSLFPKPFSRVLMPDWFLRWQDIRDIQLKPGPIAKMPVPWHYEIVTARGKKRRVKAFHWRLAGEKETGLNFGSLRKLKPELIRGTLEQTVLYRLFAKGMKRAGQQAA